MISFAGKAKQYAEVEHNLFREVSSNISLLPGIRPRRIAFQEDGNGNVTGFVIDGLPFMSLRRLPVYATQAFNLALLGASLLILLLVLLRRFYQRVAMRGLPAGDRSAINAASYAAGANWLVIIAGVIVLAVVADRLFGEIPLLFKLWLVLPIVATLASLHVVFRAYRVWSQRLLGGIWARIRYTVITLSALFICWFYWYWNILGFQYK